DIRQARQVMERHDPREPSPAKLPGIARSIALQEVERAQSDDEPAEDEEEIHTHPAQAKPEGQRIAGGEVLPMENLDDMVDHDRNRREAPEHVEARVKRAR